ncbi:hypothetical protein PR048_023310 [Dryococelus australis]|uniref:Uncharacterized protein n=1 Tax=Dryococelus australis TaxID=614101 RepID=A0ABQ9GTR5_9NEOP|nr:hypothetical protein PR048_023310 [Dryococelus australis]
MANLTRCPALSIEKTLVRGHHLHPRLTLGTNLDPLETNSNQGDPVSMTCRVTPDFPHVMLLVGWVFSGISRLPRPFIPALLHNGIRAIRVPFTATSCPVYNSCVTARSGRPSNRGLFTLTYHFNAMTWVSSLGMPYRDWPNPLVRLAFYGVSTLVLPTCGLRLVVAGPDTEYLNDLVGGRIDSFNQHLEDRLSQVVGSLSNLQIAPQTAGNANQHNGQPTDSASSSPIQAAGIQSFGTQLPANTPISTMMHRPFKLWAEQLPKFEAKSGENPLTFGFSHVEIVLDDGVSRRIFPGISHFPRALSFRRCSISSRFTLIGSQDLDNPVSRAMKEMACGRLARCVFPGDVRRMRGEYFYCLAFPDLSFAFQVIYVSPPPLLGNYISLPASATTAFLPLLCNSIPSPPLQEHSLPSSATAFLLLIQCII